MSQAMVFVGNMTESDNLVSTQLRALIYVQKQECRAALVNLLCALQFPKCSEMNQKIHCPCKSTLDLLIDRCKEDTVGSRMANNTIQFQAQLAEFRRPCSSFDFTEPQYGN